MKGNLIVFCSCFNFQRISITSFKHHQASKRYARAIYAHSQIPLAVRSRNATQRITLKYLMIERFSIECHKTKTRVITLAITLAANQNAKQIHVNSVKRGKMSASKSRLVLLLIGRESGANLLTNHSAKYAKTKVKEKPLSKQS